MGSQEHLLGQKGVVIRVRSRDISSGIVQRKGLKSWVRFSKQTQLCWMRKYSFCLLTDWSWSWFRCITALSDASGPITPQSNADAKYFVTFTDKYLRTTSVHFMCTLHDQEVRWHVLDKVREFEASVVGEAGQRIETVPTDNVAEYVNQDFPKYLESRQINHETSVPFTPQHNELAERVTAPLSRKQGPLKQVWPNHTRSMQYQRLPTCRS